MFSGLSEYLFGSSSSSHSGEAPAKDAPAKDAPVKDTPMKDASPQDVPQQDIPVEEVEMDDDWVLVDVTNEGDTLRRTSAKDGFQSKPKSVPDKPQHMEESWFITPPPCFTAGGHSPQQLATSPLEDLLIEHPSMSVYHHPSQRGGPLAHRNLRRQQHPRKKANKTVTRHTHNLRVRNAKPPRRAAAIAARAGMEQSPNETAIEEQREARKHQRPQSRGKVERHNKAYHQQSASSRRHYRQNLCVSGRHSGAIYKQPR